MHRYRAIVMTYRRYFSKMGKYSSHLFMAFLLLQVSCIAQQSNISSSSENYFEDLTVVRPKYEAKATDTTDNSIPNVNQIEQVLATNTVNAKVDMVLDSLDKLNQIKKFVDGYTIQIYSGPDREEALSSKSKMVKEAGDLEAYIQYSQPKFRVTTGKYFTKLEAQKDLNRCRRIFSNAILVPEKIMIR